MKWRIAVQILGLLTNWVFARVLRDLKHHGDRDDLYQVRVRHDQRREAPVRARHPRFSVLAERLTGMQVGLLAASIVARSPRQRGAFVLLSLIAAVVSVTITDVLLPEFYRSDHRLWLLRYGTPQSGNNVTDISDALSRRAA